MTWRQKKKLQYGFVFGAVLFLLATALFLIVRPGPSCQDNKQNGQETGVDCGGSCLACAVKELQPATVGLVRYLTYSDRSLDLVGEIINPNGHYGLVKLPYRFRIFSTDGQVFEVAGLTSLLPRQRLHVAALNRSLPSFTIDRVTLELEAQAGDWQLMKPDSLPVLQVLDWALVRTEEEAPVRSVRAEIINSGTEPAYDLQVIFLLQDEEGRLIGLAESQVGTLEPLERRTIAATIPPLTISPTQVQIELSSRLDRTTTE